MSKFKYYILPEQTYVVNINGLVIEVTGEEILDAIYRKIDDGK